jgi:transposase
MEQFVGLDVSQQETHVCVVDGAGQIVWQGKCVSTPDAVAHVIRKRAAGAVRIGFESGALSTWFWHALRGMDLPAICLDARHAKAALSMQVNKTDKNDAHGLAQIVRMGWYKEVAVKSMDSHVVRSVLSARAQLVSMRVEAINQLRGVLKTFGVVLGKQTGKPLVDQVEKLASGAGMFNLALQALLSVYKHLGMQIETLDGLIREHARTDAVCRRLMTVPGVGPVTAVAFVAAVDDSTRFTKSKSVGAFFGLTPRRYQSGEIDRDGHISKCGDRLTRGYLYEAANTLLTRVKRPSALKAWGLRIAKRNGAGKAKVAVARKMAVIMHRMWTTGEPFRWANIEHAAA